MIKRVMYCTRVWGHVLIHLLSQEVNGRVCRELSQRWHRGYLPQSRRVWDQWRNFSDLGKIWSVLAQTSQVVKATRATGS